MELHREQPMCMRRGDAKSAVRVLRKKREYNYARLMEHFV